LRPPSLVRSTSVTEDRSEANIAATIPAAPAPTMTVAGMTTWQKAEHSAACFGCGNAAL
jgi:hypothetical protein